MHRYTTLADEQSDILAGVREELGNGCADANSALRVEVCLELLAHLTGCDMLMNGSIQ